MPSFDVVSEIEMHELSNAVDQTNREIANRFDFKGTDARVERNGNEMTIISPSEFQVKQVLDILQTKMAKRGIDIDCLEIGEIDVAIHESKLLATARNGIDKDTARKIVKAVKESKIKVQAQIQQEQVRITGKKRDELQSVIAELKGSSFGIPLQFQNFRD
ncbi:MAG: YajQ family cyclic di-GMP-binding protein [Gammaproteobacteria bacterium]